MNGIETSHCGGGQNLIFRIKNKVMRICQHYISVCRFKRFGKDSVIYSPIRLLGTKQIEIGEHVSILHHSRIEAISKYNGFEYHPELIIGNHTDIGQNFHAIACKRLIIGNDVTISGNVYISDVSHDYCSIGTPILEQKLIVEETTIGDNCFIGFGAVIQAGTVLGKQCIVGANAVVLKGIYPDYSVLAGTPARLIKRYNFETNEWEKLKRANFAAPG